MNFDSPSKCLAAIRAGDDMEFRRGANRTKVLNASNGAPPLSAADATALGVKINCNFLELLILLWHARSQLESAFLRNQYFFTVKIPLAPVEYRADWEAKITAEINRPLSKSREYFELHRSRWSSVVTHGVGPMTWRNDGWLPSFVSMADLRIPTDTTIDFKNLTWYAVRVAYTPLELAEQAFSKKSKNHWNKRVVRDVLKNYKDQNTTDAMNNYDFNTSPEKLAELIKQNGALFGSDAVPTIPLFHFYFKDENDEGDESWHMRVVPDQAVVKGAPSEEQFLWESDDPIADSWKNLIHCQFGDLSTDAPFKYHSIRGLGFLLMEPTFYSNLTLCRMLQATMDDFNVWLRVQDNPDKARKQVQEFGNYCVLQSGVSVVPNTERHQVNERLAEFSLAQMKQRMGEAAASYTQDTDTGTNKEQTAFEVRVKMEQVNAMMSGILLTAFKYESYAYHEICRRFCDPDSRDKDIKSFRKKMIAAGIPERFLDVEYWDVDPVAPLGNGNPTIALSMAQQLYAIKGDLSPKAQNLVKHQYVLAVTKDPAMAMELVPLDKQEQSEAYHEAVGYFGTLWAGVPIPLRGSHLIDQIEALMPLYATKINFITKRDNMASLDEAYGLQNVSSYIMQAIQALAQDPQQQQRVKEYSDSMGRLDNEAKGLIQRGQQAREKEMTETSNTEAQIEMMEAQAKMQSQQALTQSKLQQDKLKSAQQMSQKQIGFEQDQERQTVKAMTEIQLSQLRTASDIQNSKLKAEADAEAAAKKAKATPEPKE